MRSELVLVKNPLDHLIEQRWLFLRSLIATDDGEIALRRLLIVNHVRIQLADESKLLGDCGHWLRKKHHSPDSLVSARTRLLGEKSNERRGCRLWRSQTFSLWPESGQLLHYICAVAKKFALEWWRTWTALNSFGLRMIALHFSHHCKLKMSFKKA